jgi:LCP family protein required for cell wall assembly
VAKKSSKKSGARSTAPQQRSRPKAADPYGDEYPAPKSGAKGSGRTSTASKSSKKRAKRLKTPLWSKIALTVGLLLTLTSGIAFAGVKTVTGEVADTFPTADLLGNAGKTEAQGGKDLDGAIDILLLGIDIRDSQDDKNNTRADSILILHVPASHDQAYLMSLPRDLMVDIPRWSASKYAGGRDRINAAFFFGAQNNAGWDNGMALTANTVSKLTGITFDGAATIDFGGFQRIVETLGTVHMCIESDAESLHYYHVKDKVIYVNEHVAANKGYKPFKHLKGCRDMAGWEALDYSRIRKSLSDGDYGRQRHQQQLMKAIAKKATSAGTLTDFGKLRGLMQAAGETMRLDTNGVEITDFIFTLKGLAGADLVLLKTNGGEFNPTTGGAEALDLETKKMLEAARDDTLGQFLLENPHLVNNDG